RFVCHSLVCAHPSAATKRRADWSVLHRLRSFSYRRRKFARARREPDCRIHAWPVFLVFPDRDRHCVYRCGENTSDLSEENDEARMTNDKGNPNAQMTNGRGAESLRQSVFIIPSSLD